LVNPKSWAALGAAALGLLCPAGASAGTLAFISESCESGPCAGSVWTVRDDGTGLRRLTAAPPRESLPPSSSLIVDVTPRWSSDGTRIAFERMYPARDDDMGLWVVAADGSGERQVLDELVWLGDWSPTDDAVLFHAVLTDAAGRPDVPSENPIGIRDSDVFAIRPDGTGLTRVVSSPIEDTDPTYSADGSRIEFLRQRYGGSFYFPDPRDGTYSVAPGGSDERRLSLSTYRRVSYSPDGRYGAYTWSGRLWLMNADGSDRTDVTPPGTTLFGPSELRWGADQGAEGPILFFNARPADYMERRFWDSTIYRLDAGSPDDAARPVTTIVGYEGNFDWAPAPDDPRPRFADSSAPAAFFLGTPPRGASASTSTRVIERRSLGVMAADATGIRRIRLAVARKVRRRGETLCRFAGAAGLGRARRCDRPRLIRGSSEQELIAPLKRLKPGAYVAGFSTVDVLRNSSGRLRLRPVRLR
jgi:Tol biopolymer transport system component